MAGDHIECRFRFTVGAAGIARGGRIRFANRHVCQWTPPQTTDPAAPGFSTCRTASGESLAIEGWPTIADRAELFSVMFPWQHVIDVAVVERDLAPGEVVEFVYGDRTHGSAGVRVQRFEEPGFAFRVYVDHDGDGCFLPTGEDVPLPVVGGEMSRLVLISPSDAQVGIPTRLLVRAEDRFGNVASTYCDELTVLAKDGQEERSAPIRVESGLGSLAMDFRSEGVATFRIGTASSNPVRVTADRPALLTLWGELHGHTLLSDGRGTPDDYYRYARQVAGLDVCAITDHDFMLSDEAWEHCKAVTNAHDEPGRFVTLQAYEWSGSLDIGGDRNVYFAGDDPPVVRCRSFYDYRNTQAYHGSAPQANHAEDLFNWLSERCTPGSVFVVAHYGGRPANERWHRPELERLVEAFSEHQRSEHWANSFREGRHLGIMAGGDDHIGRPGNGFLAYSDKGTGESFGLGLVGIQAKDFTREGVFEALYDRHVYATTGARILLKTTVNGAPMGSQNVRSDGPPTIGIEVHGTADLAAVQIVRDMKIVHTIFPGDAFEFDVDAYCASYPDIADAVREGRIVSASAHFAAHGYREGREGPLRPASGAGQRDLTLFWQDSTLSGSGPASYHVRVVQADGHVALSSPIACDVTALNRPHYDRDGLRTMHNSDFMDDHGFLKAYRRGVEAVGQDYRWNWRVHVGLWAARTAIRLPGDFVEFGTNRGFMSSAIMEDLDWNATGRTFFLFDTFAGLDERFITEGERRSGILERNRSEIENGFYATAVEPVIENFSQWRNVTIVAGPVPLTLDRLGEGPFAFVHIDMNCAPPEVAALRHVWDRLTPGAVVLLDDYAYSGYLPQKLAIDALAAELGFDVLSLPTGQGLLTKPSPSSHRPASRAPSEEPVAGSEPAAETGHRPSHYYDERSLRRVTESGGHRTIIGGLWDEMGTLQLEHLRSLGMLPHHKLLDIGCGALRLGAKAATYLDAGNYSGTDISESLIEAGYRHEILEAGLADRLPRSNLVADGEFTFEGIARDIDFAIAQSVFTHLPPSHLRLCLARLAEHADRPCTFVFSVFLAPDGREFDAVEQYPEVVTYLHKDPYHYRIDDIRHAARGLPWVIDYIGPWGHPKNQMIVRARLTSPSHRSATEFVATRSMSASEARSLALGSEHYTAYVGPPQQWDFMGATQFRLLAALGLREHHKVLDLGCGSLRAGRFLIAYLAAGNYHGIDPNTWLIEDAIRHQLGHDLVELKQPRFSSSSDFEADGFGVEFDFIVAQSVFSHAGPEMVETAMGQIKKTLAARGMALVTFIHPEKLPDVPQEAPGWTYPECTTYAPSRVIELIASAGLCGRELPWYHPRQTWYAIAHDAENLPLPVWDSHLSGAVLRDPEFSDSLG